LFSSGYLAQINNLRIEDCNVTGGANVGGLIGESMYNIIENTSVTGLVSGNYEVGGFIGLSAEDQFLIVILILLFLEMPITLVDLLVLQWQ
jgi:hypothetical protein